MTVKKSEQAKNEFCLCGCGERIIGSGRTGYCAGHYMRNPDMNNMVRSAMKESYKINGHHKKGKPHSASHCRKISRALTGKKFTEERKRNISIATKGRIPWNWTGHSKGYSLDWDNIKRRILKRDNHKCLLGENHSFGRYKNPDVHHIDGDKGNNNDSNLICLCKTCHGRMQKSLEYSIPHLRALILQKYGVVYP